MPKKPKAATAQAPRKAQEAIQYFTEQEIDQLFRVIWDPARQGPFPALSPPRPAGFRAWPPDAERLPAGCGIPARRCWQVQAARGALQGIHHRRACVDRCRGQGDRIKINWKFDRKAARRKLGYKRKP
jgi:hypothetical protein